eukprot:PITA_27317
MAPKNKNDPAWIHYHLNEQGVKVCNYCGKKIKRGGINRIKEHLTHWRGQVKPYANVYDDLKAEMQSLIESYNEEKGKNKRLKKDITKSQKDDVLFSDPDFEAYMPSFEESSSFPSKVRKGSSSGLNLKRTTTRKGIDSFFVPRTTPSSQPTLDAKWKKIEKKVKNAQLLFRLFDEVVMEVGAENVVQVITDNAYNYVAAGNMLEEKYPTIWWSPCAAHCLDLMLEDIDKIEWVKKCVEDEKSITL